MSNLILTRRLGETIVIGDDVRVTVTCVTRNQVRLSIDAPRSVPGNRLEVLERDRQHAESLTA